MIIGKELPTFDRNVLLQFVNKVKVPQVRTHELTRILLQFIFDKNPLLSEENVSRDNSSLNLQVIVTLLIIVLKQLVTSLYLLVLFMQKVSNC